MNRPRGNQLIEVQHNPISLAVGESSAPFGDGVRGNARVEVLRSVAAFKEIRGEWERFLLEHGADHTYMHDPALILSDLNGNAEHVPRFIVVYEGNEITCVAPFYIVSQPYRIKLGLIQLAAPRLRMLKIYGGNVVHRKGQPTSRGLDHIFRTLRALSREFDSISFFELPIGGDLWTYFEKCERKPHGFRMVQQTDDASVVHYIQLPETYDEYLSSFKTRRRKTWRRIERDFDAQCPRGYDLVKLTTPDQAEEFLKDVDTVYAKTWQARAVKRQHATIANKGYYRTSAERNLFRSYVLRVDGAPIAFSCGFQHRGVYYFGETGYDSDWRKHSPGTVLLLRMLEDLCAHDRPRECNFGFGAGLQKETFGNRVEAVSNLSLVRDTSIRGAVVIRSDASAQWFYRMMRRTVTRFGIDHWIRERIKRQ